MIKPNAISTAARVLALAALTLTSAACDLLYDPSECTIWEEEIDQALAAGAALSPQLPTGADGAPISLVLNEAALNGMFRQLSDTDLPELSHTFDLGIPVIPQSASVSLKPELPLLQLASTPNCSGCIQARVPLDLRASLPGNISPSARGAISVAVPVGFAEIEEDDATAFIARFQSIQVIGLELGVLDGLNSNLRGLVEDIASDLLTGWLRSRFSDVPIASFKTWTIGSGAVRLAPRGPFISPDQSSIRFSLVTNLPNTMPMLPESSGLPDGADAALHLHPSVLGAMGRRMNHEGFLPSRYSTDGTASDTGSLRMALMEVGAGEDDHLHTSSRVARSGSSLCGAFTLGAAMSMEMAPKKIALSVADVSISDTRGAARLLDLSDQVTGGLLSGLLDTLDFTINYDGLQAGEAGTEAPLDVLGARVSSTGLSVSLTLPRD